MLKYVYLVRAEGFYDNGQIFGVFGNEKEAISFCKKKNDELIPHPERYKTKKILIGSSRETGYQEEPGSYLE